MSKKNQRILLSLVILLFITSGSLFFKGFKSTEDFLLSKLNIASPNPISDTVFETTESAEKGGSTQSAVLGEQQQQPFYRVNRVVDGDTIEVIIDGEKKTVRLIGINTPETVDPRRPVQCFGKEASDEVKRLINGQYVALEKDISDTDKYSRLLRYVYLSLNTGERLFINDYLVRQGYAESSTYPPDVKYETQFLAAQSEARENKRGLWGRCK